MPWYEVEIEARITVCIEAEDADQARLDVYDEYFTGLDKDTSEPKLLATEEDIERSKRHADEIMPLISEKEALEKSNNTAMQREVVRDGAMEAEVGKADAYPMVETGIQRLARGMPNVKLTSPPTTAGITEQ